MQRHSQVWTIRLACVVGAMLGAPALAGVAGTGTATVMVNFITQKLGVTATFANQPGDLTGVNLGTLDPFSATGVSLSNVNVGTGASFEVPFANGTESFRAVGDIACPATGCATIPGTFAFEGLLDMVDVSILPPDLIYTFDGSVRCTGNAVIGVNCTGPYALNYFMPEPFAAGQMVVIPGTHSFYDPRLGIVRSFETRVTLTDVPAPDVLRVAAFSRLRGAIPAPYVTSTDGFEAIFFDVATGAIFTNAEVCVVVDADLNGIVDGTSTPVSKLAGLHFVGNAFVLQNTRIDGKYACVTVRSLSPFAFVAAPNESTTTTLPGSTPTTTTTPVGQATTTTTPAGPTTTTLPACATARDCLGQLKDLVDCPGGLPPALGTFIDNKVHAAGSKLAKAAEKPTKAKKFARAARTLLHAIDKKAAALAKKKHNGISAECRQSVGEALNPTLGEIDAGRF